MNETLVVVSKVKKYIKDKSDGMNTSATAIEELTRVIQKECDKAIENAKKANRKTVMDRDFQTEE